MSAAVEPLLGYVTVTFEVRTGRTGGTLDEAPDDYLCLRGATVVNHSMSAKTVDWLVDVAEYGDLDPDGSLHDAIVAMAVPPAFSVVASGLVDVDLPR